MTHDTTPIGDIRDGPYLRERYPGLRKEESRLLRAYLLDVGTDSVERLRTAVGVGPGEDIPHFEGNYREMAFRLSQWKIDAVVDYPGRTDVIELKSRANHTALGQALAYGFYIGKVAEERSNPRLKVVAFREHPGLRELARAIGAEVHLVPTADATQASRRHEVAEGLGDLKERIERDRVRGRVKSAPDDTLR